MRDGQMEWKVFLTALKIRPSILKQDVDTKMRRVDGVIWVWE
jgi:hypothetical protein